MSAPDETPWLSQDEQRAWIALAGLMIKLPGVLDSQLQRDSGLSMFEYFVLSHLSMTESSAMQMSELAAIVNGSLSRLSNVIKRLEQRGAVRREKSPDNARCTYAVLTDEGRKLVEAAAPGHVRTVRHFVLDALTPELLEAAGEIGNRVMERADPHAVWP